MYGVSLDQDEESGPWTWTWKVEGGQPLLTRKTFLIGERNSASLVRHKSFPFGRLAVSGSGSGSGSRTRTVADLQNFPGRIGGSRPNGPDLAAPDMSDQMAMCFEDRVAAAMYRTAYMPFFNRIRSTPSLSLVSPLAEAIDSRFPPLLVFVS